MDVPDLPLEACISSQFYNKSDVLKNILLCFNSFHCLKTNKHVLAFEQNMFLFVKFFFAEKQKRSAY